MQNIYLFQPNYGTGSGEYSTVWLPYSVGSLWSYVRQFENVVSNYQLKGLFYKREPLQDVLNTIADPAIVGFSNYIWNINYNRRVAAAIKTKWPHAVIVFGGPQVPDRPQNFFDENPFVDVAVHQEGEVTFRLILDQLLAGRNDFEEVPGISYLGRSGTAIKNPSTGRISDLNQIPSPYLTGVFNSLIADNPGAKWAATYETNRGCPFQCHFCDWGSLIFQKVKTFSQDRVKQDLEWFADNGIEYVFLADANFGIFKERDSEIAEHILEVTKRTGYPKMFNIQWTKNSNQEIVKMAMKLSSVQKGLTLSVQSMTDKVLTAIERRNMSINNLSEILEICNKENIPSYTELILGLPEETMESWQECFHKLLDLGQHCAIDVWIAQVLQNSALNDPDELARYQIETVKAKDYFFGALPSLESSSDVPEKIDLVRSTKSMSFDEMVESYMYGWMIMNFHLYGWTQLFSRFMRKYVNLEYRDFYRPLFDYIRLNHTRIIHSEYLITREKFREYLTTGSILGNLRDEIGLDLDISGHNLIWRSQMVFRYHGKGVFDELRPFFEKFSPYLSSDLKSDLLKTQELSLLFYGDTYPKRLAVGSNLINFVYGEEPFADRRSYTYLIDIRKELRDCTPEIDRMDINDFLYMLYFRRKLSPGTTAMRRITTDDYGVD